MIGGLRQRAPRERESPYLAWVAQLPCIACMVAFPRPRFGVQVAHVRMPDAEAGWRETGMQEKPSDRRTVPLCPGHHQDWPNAQHRIGERNFWPLLGVNPVQLCADLSAAFDKGEQGLMVLAKHAGAARRDRAAREAG
jgi:hypothetical protein